jgi:glycosyltransferase involved in cell wall biosynthesis
MLTLAVPERLAFAKKSIASFCVQTLARKTLLLVINGGTESGRRALQDYAESLERDDIVVVTAPPGLNLGELRNFSVEAARGDILCQWDDDDFHHPERLERQLSSLVTGDFEAVYLRDVMQFFPSTNTLHWTNWRPSWRRHRSGAFFNGTGAGRLSFRRAASLRVYQPWKKFLAR